MTISGGIAFLILVSIYLYANSRTRRKESGKIKINKFVKLATDFVFIWVLVSLLVFYIVSVNIGSATLFAAGNIIVEIILVAYLLKNRSEKSK
jgi:hypothetical protein